MKIKKILSEKKGEPLTIPPDATIYDALEIMEKEKRDALVVVEKKQVLGILAKGHLGRKLILKRKKAKKTLVGEAMTSNVAHVTPNQKVSSCLSLMIKNRLSHIPVFKEDQLVGLLSMEDIQEKTSQKQPTKTKKAD